MSEDPPCVVCGEPESMHIATGGRCPALEDEDMSNFDPMVATIAADPTPTCDVCGGGFTDDEIAGFRRECHGPLRAADATDVPACHEDCAYTDGIAEMRRERDGLAFTAFGRGGQ